ncbi:metal ABC transporter solute-binding protein, Zn/Mn family [Gracilibacillus alcaliphilus]|uniref:metal ABC transporter solute-binding protein, Zn/Mn family n=1 Tax=Gracilibacillus alcaliphilus TaxID=1401441 RepID=UPI00195D4ED5|nr:zinc ABC transporter substrate-binding protein [Gracilibacillus alcaliphilus]MBM7679088.1 manganese/zinc/iron transport system substrate-binding protein [Gracilibacillus alcaliphilus]
MNNWKKISVFFAMFVLFLAACGSSNKSSEAGSEEPIHVLATIAQIGEPLSVIGGEHVKVETLMGPSVDPHLYNPTNSDINKVNEADVVFYNGLYLEAQMEEMLESIASEKPVLALGDALSKDQLLEDEEGATDPHIWFDIDLWEQGLEAAVAKLKEYAPEYADDFDANMEKYSVQLEELREEAELLQEIPKEQRVLVTAHDAFGYFGNSHNMEVVGLQGLSTESEAGVSDINDTIALIEEYQVPAIFVESSVNQDTINAVVEGTKNNGADVSIGGELYSDAMGEEGTEEGTYIGMYKYNVNTIHDALTGGGNDSE